MNKRFLISIGIMIAISLPLIINVEGQNGSTNSYKKSTLMKEIYFGPKDYDKIPDERFDIYEKQYDNLVFTYQLLNTSSNPNGTYLEGKEVYLIIEMGPYKNTTLEISDERGRIHYNFTSKLRDSKSKEVFRISENANSVPINISIIFDGDDEYNSTSIVKYGDYHSDELHGGDCPIFYLCCCSSTLIIVITISLITIIFTWKKKLK